MVSYFDRSTSPIKATQGIETLACDKPPVESKARRDACKIVEGMWKAGEVGDDVLLMAARIFQDSTKAEMLLNLEDPMIQNAYLDDEIKCLQ
ncbi:hypothetical protein AMTR_s00012p00250790 [Amborella trichopoda]|uniref:Uncharacterized protein n=1 Tax=Amborella trichopoda TaxID=13333 RepID=W1PDF5_AMBTC|nr:hypothetical protein AMTR_s00012p00250790 [Amborella trichopoda]